MKNRVIEYSVAIASFIAAVVFAFLSLVISEEHEVESGNCMVIAQFLLLTASIFGLDYKLGTLGSTSYKQYGGKAAATPQEKYQYDGSSNNGQDNLNINHHE